MYNQERARLLARRNRRYAPPEPAEAPIPRPNPRAPFFNLWSGRFRPTAAVMAQATGALADDEGWTGNTGPQPEAEELRPLDPRQPMDFPTIAIAPTIGPASIPAISPTIGGGSAGSSIWDSLTQGLTKVVAIRANAAVQQTQQKALANTWNPALTGPALQAQAYQQAYLSGTGASPISTTTLVVGGLVALGLIMAVSRS